MYIRDLIITAIAPAIWGSSYIIATELLSNQSPLTIALLRALPAGLMLLLIVRQFPSGIWIPRMLVLGGLNFSIFWCLLFFAAQRLPGGVAAVVGALQPFIVIFAARAVLKTQIRKLSIFAALLGILGVALLVLTSKMNLDMIGVAAGVLGSSSMALGTVLSRRWQPPVSVLTFTAWQLTAGGVLLVPVVFLSGVSWVGFSMNNFIGIAYLALVGGALTYVIWLNGIARLQSSAVSILGFISPLTAFFLGWLVLDQKLTWMQVLGVIIVVVSIFLGQYALRRRA